MKYLSITFSVLIVITAVVMLFGTKVQLKPFSIKFTQVTEAIGFIVMMIGLSIYVTGHASKKVKEELADIKSEADRLHEKVENGLFIPKKEIPENPFTIKMQDKKYFVVPLPSVDSTLSAEWDDNDTMIVNISTPNENQQ